MHCATEIIYNLACLQEVILCDFWSSRRGSYVSLVFLVLLIRLGPTLRSNRARVFSLHVQQFFKAPLQCFDFRGDCVTNVMCIS